MKTYDIVIATYKREQKLKNLLKTIPETFDKRDIHIYFDNNDKETYEKFRSENSQYSLYLNENRLCVFGIWNRHISHSNKDGVFFLSDDLEFLPGSFESAIKCLETNFPDMDGLTGLNQYEIPHGSQCAVGLIGKSFANRFPNREPFYPKYHGRCGDSELLYTAQNLRKFKWCEEAKIKHSHPDAIGINKEEAEDEAFHSTIEASSGDLKIFNKRMKRNYFMNRVKIKMYIFIATHNGGQMLKECLESLEQNANNSTVIVIDNLSDDERTLEILKKTKFKVEVNETNGYDAGAYLYAINKYLNNGEFFLFSHDDMLFKPNFENELLNKLQNCDVLALSTFMYKWDCPEQKEICMKIVGLKEFEERRAIFGAIFLTKKDIIQKAKDKGLLWFIPHNKIEQQAMERGWGYIFAEIGAKIDELVKFPDDGCPLHESNHNTVIIHRWQRKQ